MWKKDLKYIYGPVSSWRLGSSLGIDPISFENKICTFDCVYCQLGKTSKFTKEREIYVQQDDIIDEISSLPPIKIDYITFSGRGEPTLAKNLGKMIKAIRTLRKDKIAVITNSSLLYREDVIEDLLSTDFVIAKLDAYSQESLETINRPMVGISFQKTLEGIKQLKSEYNGRFALQIMFIKENKKYASEIAQFAKEICPDEVQINTPLRPCAVKPLPDEELNNLKAYFSELNAISVYEASRKDVKPISDIDTLARRGKI